MSLIDDCNELPSMENWLNSAGADWSEDHGIIETTAAAAPLFYEVTSSTPSAISLFGSKEAVTHPFLKLDALEICKENPDQALLVRTAEERVSDQSLLDQTPSLDEYLEADSPRGPLSPAALQLGKSPRPIQGNKRPLDDWIPVWDQRKLPKQQQQQNEYAAPGFVAMAATAPTFQVPVTPASMAAAAPPTILFPAPLTLPNVPSMEEIAQTRPKRRNVKISKDPTSVAARHRRERISDRVRVLQHFVPGGTKMDTASMLDEAIHYVKFLQQQLQMLERLGNSYDLRFMTQEDPVMMPLEVGNSVRPFDLNRACYQTSFPSTSMAQQPQQSSLATWPNTKATSPFCSQGNFPDSAQEQFCH